MAAHVPRRVFAAPFVVTIAAACNGGESTPPAQRPEVVPSATPSASASSPTPADSASPSKPASWTIAKNGTTCTAELNGPCSSGPGCNPPPPSKYPCISEISEYPVIVVRKAGETQCITRVASDMRCPPQVRCNPPPPHDLTVPCPE